MKKLPAKFDVKIHSPEHCEAVQKRLFEMGFSWNKSIHNPKSVKYTNNTKTLTVGLLRGADKDITCSNEDQAYADTYITLDELYQMEVKPDFVEVSTENKDYHTIKVYADKIEVGCQIFPISLIDKLQNAFIKVVQE